MERYEAYKQSGIAWLGEIPEHWNTASMRWLTHIFAGGTPSKDKPEYWENGIIPWLNSGSVNQGSITTPSEFITEEGFNNSSAKWIPRGSVVMALAGQGKTKGTAAYLDIDTTCNQSMAAICPYQDSYSKYLYYYLKSKYQSIRGLAGDGQRDGLNLEMIAQVPCPIPSFKEQEAIASFLDRKTKLIDELIAKKQRLIELKKKERAAIINQAVTKGLDPNVPMKDSGIEWLGKIPEHWAVKKLKSCITKIGSGVTPKGGSTTYKDEGIPLIRSQNVKFEGLDLKDVAFIDSEIHASMYNSRILPNDLLLNITGASIGRCCIYTSEGEANVNQHVCIIRLNQENSAYYLNYFFQSTLGQSLIQSSTTGSGREGLNFENIGNFILCIPDLEEQHIIVNHMSKALDTITTKICAINKQIELLKEYKTALISETVTGKVKVI